MRVLITGIDEQGRSHVVEERKPTGTAFESAGITVTPAAATESSPPPPRPPGRGHLVAVGAEPGTARWNFIEFPAGSRTELHHTDSVDYDVVLEGSVNLLLDDGPHRLDAGDAVVVNGVDHGWQTEESGCRMSVVVIATPPLD